MSLIEDHLTIPNGVLTYLYKHPSLTKLDINSILVSTNKTVVNILL